ncbi:MAG TPA: hypothetical protein VLF19_12085 [Methylomirabilota bacterium]|nr:hypothetical protein [Methylomirabilota bacterium]
MARGALRYNHPVGRRPARHRHLSRPPFFERPGLLGHLVWGVPLAGLTVLARS